GAHERAARTIKKSKRLSKWYPKVSRFSATPQHRCCLAFTLCCRFANNDPFGMRDCWHARKEIQHSEFSERIRLGLILGGFDVSDRSSPANSLKLDARSLLHIFPVPRLVKVRSEAEARGVAHQPLVGRCLHLDCAICIFRVDRIAADIQVQCVAREVRTIRCEAGASRTR